MGVQSYISSHLGAIKYMNSGELGLKVSTIEVAQSQKRNNHAKNFPCRQIYWHSSRAGVERDCSEETR